MSYKPFYISSFENESGINTYLESFLIPEKAFTQLEDAYAWRGRIKRRQGFTLLGRLRRVITNQALANTTGAGTYTVADILSSVRATEPNAEIEAGSVTVTINAGGANETIYRDDVTSGTLTYVSGTYTISSGTINYVSSTASLSLNFTAAPGAGVSVRISYSYYPALPVMGLRVRERSSINDEQLICFDTKYAYTTQSGQFIELPSTAPTTWNGSNSDFFWSTNYWKDSSNNDVFWTTNNNVGATRDPIRYYDGTTWNTFEPIVNGAIRLEQCRALIPYKDRLLAFNTWEGANLAAAINYPQRLRFSQNGSPLDQTNGWRDDVVGRGGYIDAPTNEQIIGVEFVKDTLLVKFERSSWKVIYTGNETLPFVFQKINTELGSESTFSLVPFDRGVFAVSNYGITNDDSVNVARIDQQIPQFVFRINNDNDGVKRVHGIRDYTEEIVLWTYPDSADNPTYPNKVLVYNYVNGTYAIFNDSFTCLGYYQEQNDKTWATLPYSSWSSWDRAWNSGANQSLYPDIVAGNQQGFVLILNQQVSNSESLAIKSIAATTINVPNHNLKVGNFVKITGCIGDSSSLNDVVYKVVEVTGDDLSLVDVNGAVAGSSGSYLGAGRLTILNNINITTKRFSPFYEFGSQARLGYVDFFLDKTSDGEITANVFIDESDTFAINDPETNPSMIGTNIVLTRPESTDLLPFQQNQQKIWHRLFAYAVCQNFQLQLTLSDDQMFDEDINASDLTIHAMVLYLSANARLIQ